MRERTTATPTVDDLIGAMTHQQRLLERLLFRHAEMAMLIAGIPPRDDVQYELDPAGLRRASFGDVVVVFDPPAFPAKHVVVTRGEDRVEIEHLETVR